MGVKVVADVPLPQAQDRPAFLRQFGGDGDIAGAVAGDLGVPILDVGFGRDEAFRVAVPEVGVDEDDNFFAPEDDVGLAGQGFDVRGVDCVGNRAALLLRLGGDAEQKFAVVGSEQEALSEGRLNIASGAACKVGVFGVAGEELA